MNNLIDRFWGKVLIGEGLSHNSLGIFTLSAGWVAWGIMESDRIKQRSHHFNSYRILMNNASNLKPDV